LGVLKPAILETDVHLSQLPQSLPEKRLINEISNEEVRRQQRERASAEELAQIERIPIYFRLPSGPSGHRGREPAMLSDIASTELLVPRITSSPPALAITHNLVRPTSAPKT
jgi:hypothetical protein